MKNNHTLEHYQACLLGGALGDALGNPIEFQDIQSIRQNYGEMGIDTLVDPDFTDDTQMTLFSAEALIRFSLQSDRRDQQLQTLFHQSYMRWLHTQNEAIAPALRTGWLLRQKGLFQQKAPGQTCLEALRSGKIGTRNYPLNESKGCGGVMRVAPIGLYFWQDPEKAFRIGADAAALTHSHVSGFLSAGYFSALIAFLVAGEPLEPAAIKSLEILKTYPGHNETLFHLDRALEMHAGGLKPTPERLEKMGVNWAGAVGEEAMAMALFCALSYPNDYPQSVLVAVNHSGDSDSTGSITGQITGLLNGIEALPAEWLTRLNMSEIVTTTAADLFVVSANFSSLAPEFLERYL
jgi:ADP-ribosylglycohydrolase